MFSINDNIEENKTKWKDHVNGIIENRLSKITNYPPIEKKMD